MIRRGLALLAGLARPLGLGEARCPGCGRVVQAAPQDKSDKDLTRAMARAKEIAEGDLEREEKLRALQAMKTEGQRTEQDLMTAIQELKAKLKRN